jgi:hypothetical protein
MWATVPLVDGKRAFAALALSLIVACGGAAPTTGATATPGGATSSPGATSGAGTGSGTAAPTAATATGPKLGDLLSAGRAAQYKVTYKYTITGAGGMTGEQSWYFKPPKSRYDFTSNVGGQTTVVSFFNLTDGTFFCMSAGTAKTCFKAGAGMPSPIDSNPAAVFAQGMTANPSAYGGVFVENKTFAGQSGSCYDVTGQGGAGRFCYTPSGILLFQNFTASGSGITLEATNVSTAVPDSDFELPAKPSN